MKRFIDHENGTITDNQTGLTWMQDANYFEKPMLWKKAVDACKTLEISNGGWRLPERFELESLLDLTRYDPALPQGHPFENVQSSYYWSATTYAYYTSYAWVVGMYNAGVYNSSKTSHHYYVWPVRDV